ncbi:NAD(P)H-dependent oxidoreductase [Aestuariivirga litoralis]|uniref:NAD(P)H-dependent oxidoreductase n=1 Tax=Aestuariivirga litoralis TaxID=2650924 RepID=UPI0018C5A593|nr:NAD(P)H-dependent oxidoreductase [Aestuariivirga litoralis]
MKVNVIYAHPVTDSYQAVLHHRIVRALAARGDEVIDHDLYAMEFDPVMKASEWRGHSNSAQPPDELRPYIEALQWADACVFCFPTWWSGLPAILKGYFDRVWRPGVAFEIPAHGGALKPALRNIRRMGVVTTCASPWWYNEVYMQNPARKVLLRGLKSMCGPRTEHIYLTRHSVESISSRKREQFADFVEQQFARF